MKTITRTLTAERAEDGLVVLSTETPCPQDGLILKADGWDLSRFEKVAPKMFYNHATWGADDLPVGRWEDMQIRDGKLLARPVFATEEHPERAGVIAKLWDGGFLDDVSVSFHVDGKQLAGPVNVDGRDYQVSQKHELLECSVVGIGADPNAGKGRIAEAVTRGVITEEEAREIVPEKYSGVPATLEEANRRLFRLADEQVERDNRIYELEREVEARAADIDRLTAENAALLERVEQLTPSGEPTDEPEGKTGEGAAIIRLRDDPAARVRVNPDHITAAARRIILAKFREAMRETCCLATGRLPD